MEVRRHLLKGEIFAIILEPMQSEGGDRYSSNRFHLGLILMAQAFDVPLIYDEVQSGYHLGREFFWHRQFQLKSEGGEILTPDFVVCSKKSQLGVVLSPHSLSLLPYELREEFSFASLVRGLTHGVVLDQSGERIESLEREARKHLESLTTNYSKFISCPRARGLCFAFDLNSSKEAGEFVKRRFEHGLLFYPAGERTLRFRLNLSFSSRDIQFLFNQLDSLCRRIFLGETPPLPVEVETIQRSGKEEYYWCARFLRKNSRESRELKRWESSMI